MTQARQLLSTPAAGKNKEYCLILSTNLSTTMAANSTLMFSGFNPNSRNSSKVLRPPGGGSSDIFGIKGDQEQEQVETPVQDEKDNLIAEDPKSTEEIRNNAQDEVPINANEEPNEVPNNANAEKQSEETGSEERESEAKNFSPENSSSQEPPAAAANPSPCPPVAGVRGRIPPGGHSSGSFW